MFKSPRSGLVPVHNIIHHAVTLCRSYSSSYAVYVGVCRIRGHMVDGDESARWRYSLVAVSCGDLGARDITRPPASPRPHAVPPRPELRLGAARLCRTTALPPRGQRRAQTRR